MKKIILTGLLLATYPALAFDMGQLLAPPSQQRPMISLTGNIYQNADVSDANTKSQMGVGELNTHLPFLKKEDSLWTFSVNAREMKLEPNNSPFPDLYDIKVGLGYTKLMDNNRQWTVNGSLGSASDKPFASEKESTVNVTGVYSTPIDASKRWLYLINYSNNRSFLNNIPLPGIAWMYTPSREFSLILGAPFLFLNWQFSENMGANAYTLLPYTYRAQLYYKLNPVAQIYGGFDASQVVHYLHDRESRKERLFYDERKAFLGFKSPLSKALMSDFEVGYAFDRKFFAAEDYSWKPKNPTVIGSSPYAKLSLKFLF